MKPSTKDRLMAVALTLVIVSAYLFVGTQDYADEVRLSQRFFSRSTD